VKAIKHSHHGTVLRLDNESAHLLVGGGKWVYISKFEARDAAMKPRRHMWKRILLVTAAVVAMLFALALVGANAAQARPCESLATVQKKHPGQYARYRSVDGQKCWYVGKRVPAKSEFVIKRSESGLSDARNRGASQPQAVTARERPAPTLLGMQGETSAKGRDLAGWREPGTATYDEQINDAFLALCGGTCPQLMVFEDRWDIAMGRRR
jgi:hypothetical protein